MKGCSIGEVKKLCNVKGPEEEGVWFWYVLRRISTYLTWFFIRTGITANQITVLSGIVGIVGSLFYFFQNPIYWLIAWGVIQFYLVLDEVDGEVARYRKTESKFGWYLDALMHPIINVVIFIPISFSVYFMTNNLWVFALGFTTASSLALLSIHRIYAHHLMRMCRIKESARKLKVHGLRKIVISFKRVGGVVHMTLIPAVLDILAPFVGITFVSFRFLFLVATGSIFPIIFIRRLHYFKKFLIKK